MFYSASCCSIPKLARDSKIAVKYSGKNSSLCPNKSSLFVARMSFQVSSRVLSARDAVFRMLTILQVRVLPRLLASFFSAFLREMMVSGVRVSPF